jgi:hypothetical protein
MSDLLDPCATCADRERPDRCLGCVFGGPDPEGDDTYGGKVEPHEPKVEG